MKTVLTRILSVLVCPWCYLQIPRCPLLAARWNRTTHIPGPGSHQPISLWRCCTGLGPIVAGERCTRLFFLSLFGTTPDGAPLHPIPNLPALPTYLTCSCLQQHHLEDGRAAFFTCTSALFFLFSKWFVAKLPTLRPFIPLSPHL